MTPFIDEDFLLDSGTARRLYHEHAAQLPIIDYHSHLPPAEIQSRKRFADITELWLGADHYKWRLMRSAGVAEELITGRAAPRDKFLAFCQVLPLAIGNPVHHFSHLELRRLFDIPLIINGDNGPTLWDLINARLQDLDTWSFLHKSRVEIVCTTDDPADDLLPHRELAATSLATRVLPALRPDQAMRINHPGFPEYLTRLSACAGEKIQSFAALAAALAQRAAYFARHGARLGDHSIEVTLPAAVPDAATLEALFALRLGGTALSPQQEAQYVCGLLLALGRIYHHHGWAMCLHIGALRNSNTRRWERLGGDSGHDSIGEYALLPGLARLLDALDRTAQLPRTVLFCLNPAQNAVLATLLGSFQEGGAAGKLQLGPAWWFNDHREGNLEQLRTLAAHGVLGTFVGMVTDSRSFASYPRHEYFRRLLCRQLGAWVEQGEYPDDAQALAQLVRGICCDNARAYFAFAERPMP